MRNVFIICRKELRSYFVSPVAYLLLAMFAVIFGFFFWNILGFFVFRGMESQMRGQMMPMNVNEEVIRPLLSNVSVIGLFLIPMITMRLFAEEKRTGTIELLATSPVSDLQVILGKWTAAVVLYGGMLLLIAVNFVFLFTYGRPDWKPLAIGYLWLLLQAVVMLASCETVTGLAARSDKSCDATSNKRYSLSEQTVKIVKGLKQDANITYFDGPRGFQPAKDELDLYSNLSPKVHVKYVDPDKDPMVARAAGFKSNGTAIVQVGLNKNEAKSVSEEEITGALIRDLKNTTRTVCFVTGSGEHQIDDSGRNGYSRLKDLLGKDNYAAKAIDLLQKAEVPGECTVLVVAGPRGDYQQPAVDAIKKFVEDGGRALSLLHPPLKMSPSQTVDTDTP